MTEPTGRNRGRRRLLSSNRSRTSGLPSSVFVVLGVLQLILVLVRRDPSNDPTTTAVVVASFRTSLPFSKPSIRRTNRGVVEQPLFFGVTTHSHTPTSPTRTSTTTRLAAGTTPKESSSVSSSSAVPTTTTTSASIGATYRELYPPTTAYRNGTLQVDSIHTLFYEEHGVRVGMDSSKKDSGSSDKEDGSVAPPLPQPRTALFLHGGPGAGCVPNHARFFNPNKYRIVLLDQRGSGKSQPRGEVTNNTLEQLIQDCEQLKHHLHVPKWDVVVGGSWGVTLALAYAQSYPTSVGALVLRGICTLRPQEVDWLFSKRGGAAKTNPQGWTEFGTNNSSSSTSSSSSDDSDGRNALHSHYDRLLGNDAAARLEAAKSWFRWEMKVSASAAQAQQKAKEAPTDLPPDTVLTWASRSWSFQNMHGVPLTVVPTKKDAAASPTAETPDEMASKLRKGIHTLVPSFSSSPPPPHQQQQQQQQNVYQARPIQSASPLNTTSSLSAEEKEYVPAQPMLTCYYSANDRYAMDNIDILSEERMKAIRHIPCMGVQGGADSICPPDTALDLSALWPEMVLRIPLQSGHSMYDPAITHELITVIDHLAC